MNKKIERKSSLIEEQKIEIIESSRSSYLGILFYLDTKPLEYCFQTGLYPTVNELKQIIYILC